MKQAIAFCAFVFISPGMQSRGPDKTCLNRSETKCSTSNIQFNQSFLGNIILLYFVFFLTYLEKSEESEKRLI